MVKLTQLRTPHTLAPHSAMMALNNAPNESLILDHHLAAVIAGLVASAGQEGFFHALLNFLNAACRMNSGGAMVFSRHHQPRLLMHRIWRRTKVVMSQDYMSGPYILDPNYQRFLAGCGSGVYWLSDVAPDDFYKSEFYRLFYSQVCLSDYIDILWRIDDDTALSVFLERDVSSAAFTPADVAALNTVLPILMGALKQHRGLGAIGAEPDHDNLTHRKVQSSIENFAGSLLTKREREVLFYMLSGYSAVRTAERLDSSEGTVKMHRKNIHRKLEIGSQAELFALFIRCIPYATPEDNSDPLVAYQTIKMTRPATPPALGVVTSQAPRGKTL